VNVCIGEKRERKRGEEFLTVTDDANIVDAQAFLSLSLSLSLPNISLSSSSSSSSSFSMTMNLPLFGGLLRATSSLASINS